LRSVLEEALNEALAGLAISPHEEICIRRVFVPVRLRLSSSEGAMAKEWSRARRRDPARHHRGRPVLAWFI
jgi:hypothetical protein